MKMKFIFGICLIIMLISITGCGNTPSNNKNNGNANKTDIETKVEELDIKLNTTGSFNGIKFKYPSNIMYSHLGTYCIMDYMNGSEFIFRIGMYFFENKNLDKVMETSKVTFSSLTNINGKTWHVYSGTNDDGKKMTNYAYQHNDDTYTITFIYDKDISNFMNAFMNTVEFN